MTLEGQGERTLVGPLTIEAGVEGVALEHLAFVAEDGVPALVVERNARVWGNGLKLVCAPGQTGARVEGVFDASSVRGGGGLRGVDVQAGRVSLQDAELSGERAALRVVDGDARLKDVSLWATDDETGVALSGARSTIHLEGVTLSGGEQALLVRGGMTSGERIDARARASGLAFVEARARLLDVRLTGPFTHAGLFVSDSPDVAVDGLRSVDTGRGGVVALRSGLSLSAVSVSGARVDSNGDDGHALLFERSPALVEDLRVEDVEGAAVFASHADVRLGRVSVRHAAVSVVAVSNARVHVKALAGTDVLRAIVAEGGAEVRVDGQAEPALETD